MKLLILTAYIFATQITYSQESRKDSLNKLMSTAKTDTAKIKLMYLFGETEPTIQRISYWDTIIKKCKDRLMNSELEKKEITFLKKYLAGSLNNSGTILQYTNEYDKSLLKLEESISLRRLISDSLGLGESLFNCSKTLLALGEVKKSITYANECLKIFILKKNNIGAFFANNTLGIIYSKQGNVSKVVEHVLYSIKIAEKMNDVNKTITGYYNLANTYSNNNEIDKALEYFKKGFEISKKNGSNYNIAFYYESVAMIYARTEKNRDKTIEYLKKSILFFEKEKELKYVSNDINNCYLLLGNSYLENGDIDSASKYANKTIGIEYTHEFKSKLLLLRAKILSAKKEYRKALEVIQEALEFANISGNIYVKCDVNKALSDIYQYNKDYNNAYYTRIKYEMLYDSLNNYEQQKALLRSQYKLEYEKQAIADSVAYAKETELKNLDLQKKESEIKAKQVIQYSLFAGLIIVIVFTIFVFNRFKISQKQKQIITIQKHLVDEKQKEILDSINYAKRIQYTLLAHADFLKDNIPNNLVYFNPKDIVSGDFYWAAKKGNKFYLAVCDSTGHGVPGAFMSLLNIGFLSEAINEKGIEQPNEVFNFVRQRLIDNISKEGQKDGFDGILICIDQITKQIKYAAANNSPVLIQNNVLKVLDADRMPVGMGERKEEFRLFSIDVKSGDTLYLYTDGYADQFGGPRGKKFKYKQLNELILTNSTKSLNDQHMLLKESFDAWRGDLEQVDDVCIIGVSI